MTTNPQDLDALVNRADIMAGVLRMGERIAYGTDADMICALSDAITTLRRDLLAAEAALAREVWGLCEAIEGKAQYNLDGLLEDHERGYYRGQKLTAKRIRLAIQITHEVTSALDAVKRAEYARGLRDAAMAFEDDVQICTPRTTILAMIPEGE